jgi:hypothetical protein
MDQLTKKPTKQKLHQKIMWYVKKTQAQIKSFLIIISFIILNRLTIKSNIIEHRFVMLIFSEKSIFRKYRVL